MQPLSSSNLSGVEWDKETETMRIAFRSGAVYEYSGVSEDVYEALKSSGTPGGYFSNYIRDVYPAVRVG